MKRVGRLIKKILPVAAACTALTAGPLAIYASSHREAPFITEMPKVDATDFYMFNSYETGRSDYVTLIADYQPLQDAYGGPNYFSMDPDALYEIHVDNNGDAKEDLTFQFKFKNSLKNLSLDIGPEGEKKSVSVALLNLGTIGPDRSGTAALNVDESYTLKVIRGDRRTGKASLAKNLTTGGTTFQKPVDNIGNKSISAYETYARSHIFDTQIPGCSEPARVFVGQRAEPFVVNLGETFDLINDNPLGPVDGESNTIADKNVTSLVLEVHKSCLVKTNPTIAAWTTASLPSSQVIYKNPSFMRPERLSKEFVQVSRLANPLVNELVIGLKDKNKFNSSEPKNDAQFATYVTNPTLPAIVELLFGVKAPTVFPRSDLVAVFLTGVDGLNKTSATAEMMRLNTSIAAVPAASQKTLGVIGGDTAGYPNGRRPGDDVVDISLRAVMGVLLPAAGAPDGQLAYTDGAALNATMYGSTFPYLNTPKAGSPNDNQ